MSKSKKITDKKFLLQLAFALVISGLVAVLRWKNISILLAESNKSHHVLAKIIFALCDGFFIAGLIFCVLAIFSAIRKHDSHDAFSAIFFSARTFAQRFSKGEKSAGTQAGTGQKQKETYFDFIRQNKKHGGGNWKIYLATGVLFLFLSLAAFLILQNIPSKM